MIIKYDPPIGRGGRAHTQRTICYFQRCVDGFELVHPRRIFKGRLVDKLAVLLESVGVRSSVQSNQYVFKGVTRILGSIFTCERQVILRLVLSWYGYGG